MSGVNKQRSTPMERDTRAEGSEVATNGDGEATRVEESLRATRTKEKHKQ